MQLSVRAKLKADRQRGSLKLSAADRLSCRQLAAYALRIIAISSLGSKKSSIAPIYFALKLLHSPQCYE